MLYSVPTNLCAQGVIDTHFVITNTFKCLAQCLNEALVCLLACVVIPRKGPFQMT